MENLLFWSWKRVLSNGVTEFSVTIYPKFHWNKWQLLLFFLTKTPSSSCKLLFIAKENTLEMMVTMLKKLWFVEENMPYPTVLFCSLYLL